jgi:uncharacterized membrane protein YgdD (TMEM256/DUF423 family)
MKWLIVSAAFLGLASVIMGAASAHILEDRLTAQATEQVSVALQYHQLYSIILLCVGLYGLTQERQKFLMAICLTFLAGILIFSGSLYLSVFLSLPILTFGTPVGGTLLMAGWLLLAIWGFRLQKNFQ